MDGQRVERKGRVFDGQEVYIVDRRYQDAVFEGRVVRKSDEVAVNGYVGRRPGVESCEACTVEVMDVQRRSRIVDGHDGGQHSRDNGDQLHLVAVDVLSGEKFLVVRGL